MTDITPALASALTTYRHFLVSDDSEREEAIESSDPDTLTGLADAVAPLFDEINAVLDQLTSTSHPLPPDQEQLESDLNSLAQAGMEARMKLDG
jgi:ABC-type transporter Mla subunit MlaD